MKQKGAAIRGTLRALGAKYGDETVAAVMRALPDPARRALQPIVLATAWYPVEIAAAVHVAIRDVVGKGSWEISRALGIVSAQEDFTGIHRVFVRALTTESVWIRSQNAWNHYHTQGRADWYERSPGSARGVCDGVSGFNEGMWNGVAGRMQTLLLLVGARGAIVDLREPTPTSCKLEAAWLV